MSGPPVKGEEKGGEGAPGVSLGLERERNARRAAGWGGDPGSRRPAAGTGGGLRRLPEFVVGYDWTDNFPIIELEERRWW